MLDQSQGEIMFLESSTLLEYNKYIFTQTQDADVKWSNKSPGGNTGSVS